MDRDQLPLQGVIAERYQIDGLIGGGSFGTVFRVRDLLANTPALRAMGRAVASKDSLDDEEEEEDEELFALKIIRNSSVINEAKRTRREVEVVCFLRGDRNPHVLPVRSVFSLVAPFATPHHPHKHHSHHDAESEDLEKSYSTLRNSDSILERFAEEAERNPKSERNMVGILMPLLNGDLQNRPLVLWREGPLNEVGRTTAAIIGFQLLYGLDFAHRCGLVHRDIKPANILLDVDDADPYETILQLADFGLARDSSLFNGSPYICTRNYRPPEVIVSGVNATSADPKVDVWSAGCVLFEMLTGTCLFRLESALRGRDWDGLKAAAQLEVVLEVVGTPPTAAVMKYLPAENPVRSYLLSSAPRSGTLKELLLGKSNPRLRDISMEERELWYELINSCVKFFPDERPTVDQLCRHPLFQTYNIDYNSMGNKDNVNVENFTEWRKKIYSSVGCEDEMSYDQNDCARLFRFIHLQKTWR